MRKVPELQLVFDTFEKLIDFVNLNKDKIGDYWWVKRYKDNTYHLTIEPKYWLRIIPTNDNWVKSRKSSVWDWKKEIKEMREKENQKPKRN